MLNESYELPVSDETGYQRIRQWLHERAGIFFDHKKKHLLLHRLQRVCERYGFSGLNELERCVVDESRNEVVSAVMHAATTNHTYFFREPQVLDYFGDTILPTLPQDSVRLWSAAASTGDEAYTLAILAAERRGRAEAGRSVAILGTDISAPVIAHAESGIYGGSHLEQTPKRLVERYFEPVGIEQYRVADDIRRMCTFRRLNLKIRPYPFRKSFHVVFCRNVLYYFDKSHQRSVVEALYEVTEPGGWLITSVTVSLRDLDTRWTSVTSGIYRKAA
jgi:chemotaxis protein methyltransferase CheR